MKLKTYQKHIKREVSIALSRIQAERSVISQDYHANSLEARVDSVITLSSNDDDISLKDFNKLIKSKRKIFRFH